MVDNLRWTAERPNPFKLFSKGLAMYESGREWPKKPMNVRVVKILRKDCYVLTVLGS